eukprot:750709-Prymnesium_polylepis.1
MSCSSILIWRIRSAASASARLPSSDRIIFSSSSSPDSRSTCGGGEQQGKGGRGGPGGGEAGSQTAPRARRPLGSTQRRARRSQLH